MPGTAVAVDPKLCKQPSAHFSSAGSHFFEDLSLLATEWGFAKSLCRKHFHLCFCMQLLEERSMAWESSNALHPPSSLSMPWAEGLHCLLQALPSAFRADRTLPLPLGRVHLLKVIKKRSSHIWPPWGIKLDEKKKYWASNEQHKCPCLYLWSYFLVNFFVSLP